MALIGYARVSTEDQNLEMQIDALEKYGCSRIFKEKASGKKADRPELVRMLDYVRDGEDTIVIWKLDRLGRSMQDLLSLTEDMQRRNLGLVSLKDSIDMSTATGRLYFHLMACLSEFERDIIRERTMAGLQAAKERGHYGGRPRTDESKLKAAVALFETGEQTVSEICESLKISESTFYRFKRRREQSDK